MTTAFLISWLEHGPGWASRPDGYSLHLTVPDAERYVTEHTRASLAGDEVPTTWSQPKSKPVPVVVSEELEAALRRCADGSLRFWQSQGRFKAHPPGNARHTVGTYLPHSESATFIDLVLQQAARPEDLDEFIQDHHKTPQVRTVAAALGLSDTEYEMLRANPTYLYTVLYRKLRPTEPT